MVRSFWLGLTIGVILVLGFQYSLLFHLSTPVSLLHGDSYLVYFILKHWMNVLFHGAWRTLTTLPMFWGFPNSIFFTDMHISQAIMAAPIFFFTRNIVASSHIVILLTLTASFVSMYFLAWYITRNALSALLAGIIYVLNPFIFARYPDQINLFSLQFIPLIFLTFERALTRKSGPDAFLFFVFLACQSITSLYYSVEMTVLFPVYAGVRIWQERRFPGAFVQRGALVGGVLFFLVIAGLARGYVVAYRAHPLSRGIAAARTYAARPSDWLFTSEFNVLWGSLKEKAANQYPSVVRLGIYSEHTLFPGVTVMILLFLAFFQRHEKDTRKRFRLWVGLFVFSWLLSLGPTIQWSEAVQTPGLYGLIYRLNPLMDYLRVPARFAMFVYFFAALIIAQFVHSVIRAWSVKRMVAVGFVVVTLILIEYWNKPLEFLVFSPETKAAYEEVQRRGDWRVILEYPIGNLISYQYPQARSEDLDARYLVYATLLHDKTLLNGYTGFLPPKYYERANALSVNFPTASKLKELRQWGVDAIVVHRSEFQDDKVYRQVVSDLDRYGVPKAKEGEEITLFDLTSFFYK